MVSRTVSLVTCSLGVFVCYFYFGLLQERINRGSYVYQGTTERFNYVAALVAVQCAVNCLYAAILQRLSGTRAQKNSASLSSYWLAALAYLLAMVCSNKALQSVNYPTQVVGKSCKPIPVMLMGVAFAGRRYPLQKYAFVSLIVAGVAVFLYSAAGDPRPASGDNESVGRLLLLASLLMDGVTATCQERIKSRFSTTSSGMMLRMNACSVVYSLGYLVLAGELQPVLGFLSRHPELLWQLGSFAVASALGQYFIYRLIVEFGPLPCSIVTTTRKFFTVLGSVFYFGNRLTFGQWQGAAAVFSGLFLDAAFGHSRRQARPDKVQ